MTRMGEAVMESSDSEYQEAFRKTRQFWPCPHAPQAGICVLCATAMLRMVERERDLLMEGLAQVRDRGCEYAVSGKPCDDAEDPKCRSCEAGTILNRFFLMRRLEDSGR